MRPAAVHLASLLAAALTFAHSAGAEPPVDAWGRPVLDERGRRLEYDGPRDVPWPADAAVEMPAAHPKSFDALRMRDDATIGNFTQDLGTKGIHAVDSDADGLPEIVVAHGAMWYLLEYVPQLSGWVQRYFLEYAAGSTFGGGTIMDVRVGETDGDATPEVVVLLTDGTFEIRDARTGQVEITFDITLSGHADFEVEDVDGVPGDEIVELDSSGLRVFTPGSSTPLWSVSGLPGTDVAIGNVDGDPAKEIVLGSGSASQVVDCGNRATEWAYSTGFGDFVDVADVDGDGIEEIAGCFNWGSCQVVDGDTRVEKWAFDNFDSSAIRCRDVNGDGLAEVGIGDGQWGDVHFHDGTSGADVGRVANPEHSVAYIDFADVDGDCDGEVLWGAGYSSTGNDHVYVGSLRTGTFEWKNLEYDGPMHAFVVADVDADGRTEIVRACSESDAGYDGAYVFVTDLHARRDEWIPTRQTNDGWMITRSMAALQADADPQLEYVMNASSTYSGKVGAFDGVTHQQQWISAIFDGEYVNTVATGDPDDDGDVDVLVGTGREHTGADGVFLRILQGTDGAVLYRSPSFAGSFGAAVDQIRVADVDADGGSEIVFINEGVGIRVYDGTTHAEEWLLPATAVNALDVADLVPGGALEIVAGGTDGRLAAYDGASHAPIFSSSIGGGGSITSVRIADVDADGALEIVVGQAITGTSTSVVEVLDPSDQRVLWTSTPIVGSAGDGSCLYVTDADDDGQNEIAVSGSYTLRFFEHDDGMLDSTAPSFAGAEAATPIAAASCCPSVDIAWNAGRDDVTPPLQYDVHRSRAAGFTPDATTRIATTGRTSWRDTAVLPGTTYHYVVRARDAAGNEDANLVRASVSTSTNAPPVAPTGLTVTDLVACDLSGVQVEFVPATAPPGTRYDLQVDATVVATGVASPRTYSPGNANPHGYRVVARNLGCNLSAPSETVTAVDAGTALAIPVISTVIDADPCVADGLVITFVHAGFAGAGRYDVLMDGAVAVTDAVSPVAVLPPDGAAHPWVVRAVDLDCARSRDSVAVVGSDGNRQPAAPTAVTITDPDPCAPSVLTLTFSHPGFPGAGHYDLWRDGSLFMSPVVSGQRFSALDGQEHDYVVRATDDGCVLSTDAAAVAGRDQVDCATPVLEVALGVAKEPGLGAADVARVTWTPAAGAVLRHDVYAGTLGGLWTGRAYDHVAQRAGLSFPEAPLPSSGCGATDAATLTTRIDGLGSAAYVLVVAVGTDGVAGPFGARSDGLDRHDPAVDPRPAATFCP